MIPIFCSARRLRDDNSAVALIEFAYGLPVFMALMLSGSEMVNYITTKMRISQVALHIADHTARMGSATVLSAKTISETQINDVLTGAGLQAGKLDLYTHGRVVVTNLEPMANPNTSDRYKVTWQRCSGAATYPSNTYGSTGQTNMTGIGPAGRQVKSPDGNATMFVEVRYVYRPLVAGRFVSANLLNITETASMTVRERRDLTVPIPNPAGVPVSNC